LEEKVKNREVLISKLNVDKDEIMKEIEISQIRATKKPTLKAAKHVI
jgi:hypothetical protein